MIASDLLNQMAFPSEGMPHGAPPAFGWPAKPLVQLGNNCAGANTILFWYQLFEEATGSLSKNTRIWLGGFKGQVVYGKRPVGVITTAAPSLGALYVEDFANNDTIPANTRTETGGGFSVYMPAPNCGRCYHSWMGTPTQLGMFAIDPSDLVGMVATIQAGLVLHDPAGVDDRSLARFVLSVGADYYHREPDGSYAYKGGIAEGQFQWVTPARKTFGMTTLTADQLAALPA